MSDEFQVVGSNGAALFTLKVHRGDGMALLAMNWKDGQPADDFVGFAIEYKEPGGHKFFSLKIRLSFEGAGGAVNPNALSTMRSPIQKFRWVHFPRNAELPGDFVYRVSPVFMNDQDELSYGEPQEVAIELRRKTYPGPRAGSPGGPGTTPTPVESATANSSPEPSGCAGRPRGRPRADPLTTFGLRSYSSPFGEELGNVAAPSGETRRA